MADTFNEITMDFKLANAMADRLQRLGAEMDKLADDRYYGTLRSISNHWKGENAEAYLKKGNKAREKLSATASDIYKAAETVRAIAEHTYGAEMKAWQIAQARKD